MTPLDLAHERMQAGPEDDTRRLRFYERLADSEMFLLLQDDPRGDKVEPMLFEVEGQNYALIFDRQDRLAEFVNAPVPFVAMSGRRIVRLLRGQGIGLGLNLGVAPSSMLLPAGAVDWLVEMLDRQPARVQAKPVRVAPPGGLPETLVTALDAKLATMGGLARVAYLAHAEYQETSGGDVLAVIDAQPAAQAAIASALSEALSFSGVAAGTLDVMFLAASDPLCAHLAKVGLRFDLPSPEPVQNPQRTAPGRDPDNPPILR
jgi:SseB protein N-terminal domain